MSLKLVNGVYHWRKTINGHPMFRSTKTGDLKTAEQLATLWEAEALRSIVLQGEKPMNLHAVIKAFLEARRGSGGYANACVHLRHFQALPNVRMSDLRYEDVMAVIDKRRNEGASNNTLVVTVSYWNALVNFASERNWSTAVKLPRIPVEKTRMRFITSEEEAALFAAIDPTAKYPGKCERTDRARQDNWDLLVCLLDTGARYREIARMNWNQVDLESGTVFIVRQKGGNDTTLLMSSRMREVMKRRRAAVEGQWVFPTKMKHNNNYLWLKAALKRAGITHDAGKITLHTARHTAASRLLHGGLNILEVKEFLGHKALASTQVYTNILPGAVAEKALRILEKR